MSKSTFRRALLGSISACQILGLCLAPMARAEELKQWPHIQSAIPEDAAMEAKIRAMVAGMTLRQKIGQMTQAEIKAVTPDDVRKNYLGSVLNGGGSWPYMMKHATLKDWVAMSDGFYDASMRTDMKVKVPLLWGTDAVHGHGNVIGATLFPHNIGLGAAHDPELIREIGAATGRAVRATGINWVFAPTLAVVEDQRWGRTYEGFSSDPLLVRAYATTYVEGMQGHFSKAENVVGTAKHYIGDGGTLNGKDQGMNVSPEAKLMNYHAQGYYGALGAGVQTVMASYSSWTDGPSGKAYGKMHGNEYLLTEVLKGKMGFDGFVISDWNAVGQIPGCLNYHCPQAINAGVDMMMVPLEWDKFIDATVTDVESGAIPMSRIDDAVTRILRVKMRAGIFGKRPSSNPYAGKASAIQARDLARRAVAESLVLLKNNGALPLKKGAKILVVGKSADNLGNQTGGWTITWQGTDNANSDFPNADSILTGIKAEAGAANVTYSADASGVDVSKYDAVIAVIGETPYAETAGDITNLSHTARHPEDVKVLQAVSGKGKPVITVFESGRTAYANDLINLSDAFVAAWLPGSEGKGVTDVLFGAKDFKGTLSFDWPSAACPTQNSGPLFALGYGLSYAKSGEVGSLPVSNPDGCQ
ncbi:glycoside hydrolase family 3 protein [Asticcacaulis sp. 201]|uniref:glycoside hydrolase family 3 protein n=1 Tax=Asticcacaulis sp. 201 TaxID=3028787 RepID=UPI002915F354|nr:glycoside hydrolase family 3 protein [Asticcacaulis sp. 201]MDV6331905.1 glycoside hydrolase family 3 protein [Asticcacaulis sp. 201]